MASIGSGSSLLSSMQYWQAKQKSYTATYLNNAASLGDDISTSTLTLSQNMATFAGQQALARIQTAAASKNTTTSNAADPFASANVAKKLSQIVNGTAFMVANATSTTDAAKTVSQIINGTAGLVKTGSPGDVTKTINQIIAGTDKLTTTAGSAIDMMSLTKIMYNIDKLPLPPTTDVAT
ncbi:MAG: hypothetical protein JWN71_461 [Xanthobacteraceae bacterium]|jgi:hypothetical protein|nr:hypothetical protein [Xanthobacteraceae bacterium]